MPIYDEIRQAIEASEMSRYRLNKESGISQSQLSDFMKGKRGLSIEALERLAACLGLEIVTKPKKQTKGQRKVK